MTWTILALLATAVIAAVLIRGEISRHGLAHDLAVSTIGIEARDARITEQERLLRAMAGLERKGNK